MPRTHTRFVCQQCGRASATYLGKCPQCGSFNSKLEELVRDEPSAPGVSPIMRFMRNPYFAGSGTVRVY
jgi:predicted ATP-dependent serine protease